MSERELCQVAAVIPAAGIGRRMGAGRSKALLTLGDQPILRRAVAPLLESGWVDVLVVVGRAEELEDLKEILAGGPPLPVPAAVVPGGAERSDSVRAGLDWLASWPGWAPDARRFAAIHDAARPLLTLDVWRRVLTAAIRDGAALPALPVVDTLKRVDADGLIQATVDRTNLWQVQTPQVFEFEKILAAHHDAHQAGAKVTDDAQIFERAGLPVRVVPGDRDNIKVTAPEDLVLAEAILRQRGEVDADRFGL